MSFSIIIPSRYGSTRLDGKPLLDIAGKSMVQRVYEQACKSDASEVLVATDDQRIADAVNAFGGEVVMTLASHPSGTDRLQEVVTKKGFADNHIVVNVQGDEPLIPPEAINQVAKNLFAQTDAGIATLCEKIIDPEEVLNPNAVKVVRDNHDKALYFSRAPIPWLRGWPAIDQAQAQTDAGSNDWFTQNQSFQNQLVQNQLVLKQADKIYWYRHIGIYAYKVSVLNDYVSWPVSMLERAESLEQLRALVNAVVIHCAEANCSLPAGVDTAADLERVREYFAIKD